MLACLPHNGLDTHVAGAQHYVGFYVGLAVLVAQSTRLAVFEVQGSPAGGIFFEQSHGVLPGVLRPKRVHLKIDVLCLGARHERIEERTAGMGPKLVAVRMIQKRQAGGFELLATFVEYPNGPIDVGNTKFVAVVGYPEAAHVFAPEKLSLGYYLLELGGVLQQAEVNARTYGFEAVLIKQALKLFLTFAVGCPVLLLFPSCQRRLVQTAF